MPLTPGSRFGAYEVLAQLGSGGMGEVYRARDQKLGRDVAIKVLREEYTADAERLARFEREARAASALNHPAIVTIFDIGDVDGTPFIAMELIRGRTLRDMLEAGALASAALTSVAIQSADGLAKAHDAGIVHRDLKPENLMITDDGFLKILDFGLAKLMPRPFELDPEGPTIAHSPTRSGMLLGTVEYMSPEQASGRAVDHRADQFALGLVMYEMATGERPFTRATMAQTLAAIIEAEAPRLDNRAHVLPAGLAGIVARCLEKDPRNRFESTRDLAQALKDAKLGTLDMRPESGASRTVPVFAGALSDRRDYHVQTGGHVRRMSERKLRRKLQRNEFSGLEMVRREGDERWEVLHDSRVFLEEVPVSGNPRDAARWRLVRGLGGHVAAFIGVSIGMTVATGHFPFWVGFWAIGLVTHGLRVLPEIFALLSEGKLRLPGHIPAAVLLRSGRAQKQLSPEFIDEADRVRSLLKRRGKDERRPLLMEIDRLVAAMSALSTKQADLEEQTSEQEFARLRQTEREARAKLETTESEYDRQLLGRQLAVIETRRRAIDKALVLLDRMRVRRSLVEHQLKQLRLDLSQAEARRMASPELSSRILDIRHEVDAFDEADEMLARD